MNEKYKLLVISVMSLVVSIGGGYLFYSSYASMDTNTGILVTLGIRSEGSNNHIIAQPTESGSRVRMNSSRSRSVMGEEPGAAFLSTVPTLSPDGDLNTIHTNSITERGTLRTKRNFKISSNNESLMAAAATNGKNGRGGSTERGSYGNSISIDHKGGRPMAVPFVDEGTALVDPGPTVLDSSTQIVPIGQGTWFLGVLVLFYGALLWVRRK